MLYRRFGKTELQIPVFTCGGMRFQHSWKDLNRVPKASQERLEATVRRAIDLGINHIETARGYGSSEYQLGRILSDYPREELIVQTKVAPAATADEFERMLERSLSLLKLDYVDLMSLHGVNSWQVLDWSLGKGGCLEVVRRYMDQGVIRHVGFSTHGPLELILRAIESEEFEYVNLHWYYINQRNWPAIERARGLDMGVFIISPTDKGGRLYAPPPALEAAVDPLSPMLFNDLFCLSRPQVHTLSIGASRPSDFDEHVKALPYLEGGPEELTSVVAVGVRRMRQGISDRLGVDRCTFCHQCLTCPEDVNIPEILRLRNLDVAFEMRAFGQDRYNLLGNGGHWAPGQNATHCNECGDCLPRCPENLDIVRLLRDAHGRLHSQPKLRLSES